MRSSVMGGGSDDPPSSDRSQLDIPIKNGGYRFCRSAMRIASLVTRVINEVEAELSAEERATYEALESEVA